MQFKKSPSGLLLVLLTLVLGIACPAFGEVRLPKVFGSHMVLQQGKPLVFWGWAQPNEKITIKLNNETRETTANEKGEWKMTLPAMSAGGPYEVTVSGSNTVRFEDVMVGEVWLCSGQSNMEMGIGAVQNAKEEIAKANYPGIRLLKVAKSWTPEPQSDIGGEWKLCTPQTIAEGGWNGFSAAAYFFGRELHQRLGVTVGLLDSTWGGTRIESWTPPEGFAEVPALKQEYERVQLGDPRTDAHKRRLQQVIDATEQWVGDARKALTANALVPKLPEYPAELLPPHDLQNATALFDGMIHPLCPYSLRGAIWYQGESNSGEGRLYTERMKALVGGWRNIWGEGEFPFFFVQIAPYNYGGNGERIGEFWEAQALAAEQIPNVGMAVINDIGNLKDIHPKNKQEVGRRLALLALNRTYGKADVVCSGPVYKNMKIEGDKLRVAFDHSQGLASRDGQPLTWFEIIDADEGGFVKADARIDGETVVLSSPEVKHPVAMRFAWNMLAEPNLVNGAGLPASAFRAGTVPKRDLLGLHVPEAKQYRLVYDIDLGKLGAQPAYDVNNATTLQGPFDRVAYFLELQKQDGDSEFLFVSMDAFTDALGKVGIPTVETGARFQQNVSHMDVYSNVKGVVTGTGLSGGNIEFWPNNYGPGNGAKVPHASDQTFDFGDEMSDPADGYGSMQVHNHDARQTLFAVNHWREGAHADIGIGNQPQGNPDWTFAGNAGAYISKRLRVMVRPAGGGQ